MVNFSMEDAIMDDTTATEVTRVEKGKETQKATPVHALSPFEEMDRWFDRWFEGRAQRNWLRPFAWERPLLGELELPFETKMPKVDIVDQDDKIVVRAEVPGVDKKDLEISVTDTTVTLKGKSSHEQKEEKGNYYRCEISRGAFSRMLTLPHEVDADQAQASFKDGLLELTMPKLKKANRRTVKID
jgi:HSP20 family protein